MGSKQCDDLLQQAEAQLPNIFPRIVPKGYNDKGLVEFCKTEKQVNSLQSATQRIISSNSSCTICKSPSNSLELNSNWKISFSTSTYQLHKLHLTCSMCTKALNFSSQITHPSFFLHIGPNICKSHQKDDDVIKHFLNVNKLSDPSQELLTSDREIFHQWISLIFSIQLFSNYANLTILDNNGAKFSETTNFDQILETFFPPAPKKTKPSSPKQTTKQPRANIDSKADKLNGTPDLKKKSTSSPKQMAPSPKQGSSPKQTRKAISPKMSPNKLANSTRKSSSQGKKK